MTETNPKGQHDSKRGPTPAGRISRNPQNISKAYVRGGVILPKPRTDEEEEVVAWWTSMTPDGRMDALVRYRRLRRSYLKEAIAKAEEDMGHA